MKQRLLKLFPYIGLVVTLLSISCSSSNNSIKMKGSDTEVNLAEKFTEQYPTFSIAISGGGSGLGITSLLNGQAEIANSSTPLSEEEQQQSKEKKLHWKRSSLRKMPQLSLFIENWR